MRANIFYDWLRQQARTQNTSVSDAPFTRRAARESLHWRVTQLNYHLERLCRDEYVVRCGGSAGKLCQYQLLYDGKVLCPWSLFAGRIASNSRRRTS